MTKVIDYINSYKVFIIFILFMFIATFYMGMCERKASYISNHIVESI